MTKFNIVRHSPYTAAEISYIRKWMRVSYNTPAAGVLHYGDFCVKISRDEKLSLLIVKYFKNYKNGDLLYRTETIHLDSIEACSKTIFKELG